MQLDYDRLDKELLPMLDDFPALDITRDNIVQLRELLASRPQPPSAVTVESRIETISTDDGDLDIHVFRKDDRGNQPALIWIHGGGYLLGNADDERARVIAVGHGGAFSMAFAQAALRSAWFSSGVAAYLTAKASMRARSLSLTPSRSATERCMASHAWGTT